MEGLKRSIQDLRREFLCRSQSECAKELHVRRIGNRQLSKRDLLDNSLVARILSLSQKKVLLVRW